MKLEVFDKNNANKKKFYICFSLIIVLVITIVSLFTMSIYEVQTTDVSAVNATVRTHAAILKSYFDNANGSIYSTEFHSDEYANKIKTVTFERGINVPLNAVEEWQIGQEPNPETVIAYVVLNVDGNNYDLHIQSNVKLNANVNMTFWLSGLKNLETIDGFELVDFSRTSSMSYMFYNSCTNASNIDLDLANINSHNVTNMNGLFYKAGSNSTNFVLNAGELDTTSAVGMHDIFRETGINSSDFILNLDNFDTSNVNDMSGMFYGTGYSNSLFTIDVSGFNTSNVIDMSSMFYYVGYTSTVIEINVSHFDTSNVNDMSQMFTNTGYNNTSFTLDVSGFDTSNVTDMTYMFYQYVSSNGYQGAKSTVYSLDLSNWDTSNVVSMAGMFYGSGYSNTTYHIDVSHFDTSSVYDMSGMFGYTGNNTPNFSLDVSNWDTKNVTNMFHMFVSMGDHSSTIELDLSNWDTSKVTQMGWMFNGISYLKIKFGDNFSTSKVYDMAGMFSVIHRLEFENYQIFDTSSVLRFGSNGGANWGMFRYCYYANLEMDIFPDGVSDDDYIVNTFNGAATTSGSDITLNYTSTNESFVDQLLATATSSNVHKGRELEKHNITISTTGVSSSLTSSERTRRIRLYTTIPKTIKSFKLNGELVEGTEFVMPDEEAVITDIEFEDFVVVESSHFPYANNLNEKEYINYTFAGATSLTIELTYQTEGISYDYIYIYDEEGSTTPYGGLDNKYGGKIKKTQIITIQSNYIKITFTTDEDTNEYYGLRAKITPNYD